MIEDSKLLSNKKEEQLNVYQYGSQKKILKKVNLVIQI